MVRLVSAVARSGALAKAQTPYGKDLRPLYMSWRLLSSPLGLPVRFPKQTPSQANVLIGMHLRLWLVPISSAQRWGL
jgi:hypothetical protein